MSFNGFFDNLSSVGSSKGNLGDWRHAARLYIDNNMRLAPKFKFLYHVVLNINPSVDISALGNTEKLEINLLAKTVDLPRYRIQTQTVNQYNRKKQIQTGVDYSPINIEFHDDNAGLTTLLWESYFRYYYADSNYTQKNPDGTPKLSVDSFSRILQGLNRSYGDSNDVKFRYGLDKSNKKDPFFSSIQIYQLHPQNGFATYTSFTLINPIISQFEHDTMDQSASEFTLNRLSINYESVQYGRGLTSSGTPTGFSEIHYDKTPSPIGSISNPFDLKVAGLNNSSQAFSRGLTNNSNIILNNIENSRITTTASAITTIIDSFGNYSFSRNESTTTVTVATPKNL